MTGRDPQAGESIDDQAYVLMQSAVEMIPRGKWQEAAAALENAAALHANAARAYDQSRCLQIAATLRRAAGEQDKSRLLAEQASAVAPSDKPLAVSIAAEHAEMAFAEGRYRDAVSACTTAIDKAAQAELKAEVMSALFRRRAESFVALKEIEQASKDFAEAYRLVDTSLGKETARFVSIDEARIFFENGYSDRAEEVLAALEANLENEFTNTHQLAELLVLRARMARAAGQIDEAAGYARHARDFALQAVAPVSYFAASVELSAALQTQGDLSDSYGTLATAYATLSDLLGKETASSWIEPLLLGYHLKWGAAGFEKAKTEYEAGRRAEIKSES